MPPVVRHDPSTRQLHGVATVAAPVVAAAAVTVLGVLGLNPTGLRFAYLAQMGLVVASILLLTSVNAGIWATYHDRQSRSEREVLEDDASEEPSDEAYDEALAAYMAFTYWTAVVRNTYRIGLYVLFASLGIALIPNHGSGWHIVPCLTAVAFIAVDLAIKWSAPKVPKEKSYWEQ